MNLFEIYLDRSINRIVINTDDPTLHYFLETKTSDYQYIPWKKEWGYVDKTVKIYDPGRHSKGNGTFQYVLGIGWACYLLGIFKDKMSTEDYNNILNSCILADSFRTTPFKELRDYQNDDVLFLLRYRVGLYVVNTGYGKTQTIATLTNYAHKTLGKRVLIVCPSNKARDELVKRCKNAFGLEVSNSDKKLNGYLDCMITSGLMNSKKAKDPALSHDFKKILAQYEWVLVDEVQYTINSGGEFIYDACLGAERFYAFSGTADKAAGEVISFKDGLSEVVVRNKNLVKYFGPSLIYRMPLNMEISYVRVKTAALDNLQLGRDKIDRTGNVYMEIMSQIWGDPGVCQTIIKICKHYKLCYIPINNLVNILYNWIDNYFLGRFRVLLVCGEGYVYYDLDGSRRILSGLQEACDLIRDRKVDVIPSTSSGFRALDLPGLENICLFAGKLAGVTLQQIGRCARGKHMNVITVEPYSKRKIPIYTNGAKEREDMIRGYYKYCTFEDVIVEENNL